MTLKHILSRYRHLPGIESVRMDTQTFGDIEAVENKADFKNTSILEGEKIKKALKKHDVITLT